MQESIAKIVQLYEALSAELAICKKAERGWKKAATKAKKLTLELAEAGKEFRRKSIDTANTDKS